MKHKNSRNADFLIFGLKMIFKRNWKVDIDSHEIDLKITFKENYNILYGKYVKKTYYTMDELI